MVLRLRPFVSNMPLRQITRTDVDAQADVEYVYVVAYGEWKQWPPEFPARKSIPKYVIDACKKFLQREQLIFMQEMSVPVKQRDKLLRNARTLQNQCMVEAESRLRGADWGWFLWINKYGALISETEQLLNKPSVQQLGKLLHSKWEKVNRLTERRIEIGAKKRKQVLEEGRSDVASDRHIRRIKAGASGPNKNATKKKVLTTASKKRARKTVR